MTRKAIKHGTDSRGRKLALVDDGNGSFTVLVKCANYAAHVRGGIAYTWRAVSSQRGPNGHAATSIPLAEATAIFLRRNKAEG